MKTKSRFSVAALAAAFSLVAWAQPEAPVTKLDPLIVTENKLPLGAEIPFDEFQNIQIQNLQGETLGRIKDLGVDLTRGQIVEVLVTSDNALDVANKVVGVPPLALVPDLDNQVFRLNVSAAVFKAAPAVDLANWVDADQKDRIAAGYAHFGVKAPFLADDASARDTKGRQLIPLGDIERCSKLLELPVGNPTGDSFGKVWSLTLDICRGRIRSVIILAPGNFRTRSVVPAMALTFNAARDGLILDLTKKEFSEEPRYIFTPAAYGQDAYSRQETYKGPRTLVALEQGRSYRDLDRTARINRDIGAAKINGRFVEVGTLHDRVTVRGTVDSAADKARILQITIAASRRELVDDQIDVVVPVASR